jgi:hypothetical protein
LESCLTDNQHRSPEREAELARKRQEEFDRQPKIIGTVVTQERGGGFVIDPITGEKR